MAGESARLTASSNSIVQEPLPGNIQITQSGPKIDQNVALGIPHQGSRNDVNRPLTKQPEETNTDRENINSYQRRKQVRTENLVKIGVDPEIASKLVLKHQAAMKSEWVKNNSAKANLTRRKSYAKVSKEKREKINEAKRKAYRERTRKDPTSLEAQKRREKEKEKHSLHGRFQAKVRSSIKKGMSDFEANQAARVYLEDLRDRDRRRAKKYRQRKKGESQDRNQHSQ